MGCKQISRYFLFFKIYFLGSLYTSKSTGVTVDVDKHLYKIETPSAPALPTEVSTEETDASKKPNKYNKVEASSPQFISRFFDGKFGTGISILMSF